ncbi:rust resistance kinase Lr10-like isoform X4 [Argentina anserina]|uniref:rust resistance kinase Lr10-like isoform X4 n=1 Tax=Argentina anserina TaxID=57926 RepID=UPI0021765BF8|nr:rust resistance kinase Lr10-like isoform X4 [Potentilla anserina]
MAPVTLFISFLLTYLVVLHSAAEETVSKLCAPTFCKDVSISFPFRYKEHSPECGLFPLNCSEGLPPRIQLKEGEDWHEFTKISKSEDTGIYDISIIVSKDLQQLLESRPCSDDNFEKLSLPSPTPRFSVSSTSTMTLLKCSNILDRYKLDHNRLRFGCISASHTYYYFAPNNIPWPPLPQCSVVQLPLIAGWNISNQHNTILTTNFILQVTVSEEMEECFECYSRGGICLLPHVGQPNYCSVAPKETKLSQKIGLGLAAGVVCLVVLVLVTLCYLRRKLSSIFFWKKQNQSCKNLEAFLSNFGPLQVKRYSYLDVKKMTNSFEEKLGQGGYGGVYKGKLKSGPVVAVKVLNGSKGNGEDFMNEVAAISRTSHVNIVSLLGFCLEGSKRALVYEFMPNGSLEKYIFDASNSQEDHHLGWEALDQISIGIARGLEYLHRGCNTRILHFDIKPHNILLDENFLPKISDFGLAKICDRKESIVSMLYARGTAGYIAPEVFCRSFGGVSHKSDVYSYGMMLSEMAGGRRNINVEAENTSEIYFPHWIYNRLELDEDLGLDSIKSEEDKERARKVIIVSLWCIQTDPSNRPAMKEVIEMLEGSVESLKIPPKPYLSSPPRSPAIVDSSSTPSYMQLLRTLLT